MVLWNYQIVAQNVVNKAHLSVTVPQAVSRPRSSWSSLDVDEKVVRDTWVQVKGHLEIVKASRWR